MIQMRFNGSLLISKIKAFPQLKQHIRDTVQFAMRVIYQDLWFCGIWQWTNIDWCDSFALKDLPLVQSTNAGLEWLSYTTICYETGISMCNHANTRWFSSCRYVVMVPVATALTWREILMIAFLEERHSSSQYLSYENANIFNVL